MSSLIAEAVFWKDGLPRFVSGKSLAGVAAPRAGVARLRRAVAGTRGVLPRPTVLPLPMVLPAPLPFRSSGR